jgi:hypothetical protein
MVAGGIVSIGGAVVGAMVRPAILGRTPKLRPATTDYRQAVTDARGRLEDLATITKHVQTDLQGALDPSAQPVSPDAAAPAPAGHDDMYAGPSDKIPIDAPTVRATLDLEQHPTGVDQGAAELRLQEKLATLGKATSRYHNAWGRIAAASALVAGVALIGTGVSLMNKSGHSSPSA